MENVWFFESSGRYIIQEGWCAISCAWYFPFSLKTTQSTYLFFCNWNMGNNIFLIYLYCCFMFSSINYTFILFFSNFLNYLFALLRDLSKQIVTKFLVQYSNWLRNKNHFFLENHLFFSICARKSFKYIKRFAFLSNTYFMAKTMNLHKPHGFVMSRRL